MNYEEFAAMVQKEMTTVFSGSASVEFHRMTGNNGQSKDALCVVYHDRNISPVIYLKPFYEEHRRGRGIVDILTDMTRLARDGRQASFPVHQLSSWSYVKDRICGKLVGLSDNRAFLEQVPHRKCMDMALVYYILFDDADCPMGSAVVRQENLELWGRTEEDLYRASGRNLAKLLPAGAYRMEAMLDELLRGGRQDAPNLLSEEVPVDSPEYADLYVITNSRRWLGAVALFYDRVLDTLMERLELEEAYIIPSSIHEMILVPGEASDEARLTQMVEDVNNTSVEAEERLTYSVYRYVRREQKLSRIGVACGELMRLYGLNAA